MKIYFTKISALILSCFYFFSNFVNATPFNEKSLVSQLLKDGSASIQNQIDRLQADEITGLTNKPYQTILYLKGQYLESEKDPSNSFQPALENSYGYSVEINKAWNFGAKTKIGFQEAYSKLNSTLSPIVSHEPYFLKNKFDFQNYLLVI